jgi:hypothetical protein
MWVTADTLKTPTVEELWQLIGANMLMLHGLPAMIALVLLGARTPIHVLRSWRAGKNRISSAAPADTNAQLVMTA